MECAAFIFVEFGLCGYFQKETEGLLCIHTELTAIKTAEKTWVISHMLPYLFCGILTQHITLVLRSQNSV